MMENGKMGNTMEKEPSNIQMVQNIFGEWKDGKRHGQGTYIMSDGSMYAGQWKDSVPNGEGTYTFTDGKIDKGIWKKGKLVERKK